LLCGQDASPLLTTRALLRMAIGFHYIKKNLPEEQHRKKKMGIRKDLIKFSNVYQGLVKFVLWYG
jgi:hypothetical protein